MQGKVIYIIAGPNGSGKTTFAQSFIEETGLPFVNADEIAFEFFPQHLKNIRIKAGKVFLKKIEELIVSRNSFILESTLSGKYLIRFMKKMKQNAYRIELIYIFIENIEEAVYRIDIRIRKGGHPVPEEDIARRFTRSKINFWNIYRFLADDWKIFLNSKDEFLQIAVGEGDNIEISNESGFDLFKEGIV